MKKLIKSILLCSFILFSGVSAFAQDDAPKTEESTAKSVELKGVLSQKVSDDAVVFSLKTNDGQVLTLPAGQNYANLVDKNVVVKATVETKDSKIVAIKSVESVTEAE